MNNRKIIIIFSKITYFLKIKIPLAFLEINNNNYNNNLIIKNFLIITNK